MKIQHSKSKVVFPIAIELGDDDHAFGVVVPDLPGCFSAGDSVDGHELSWMPAFAGMTGMDNTLNSLVIPAKAGIQSSLIAWPKR